MPMRLEDPGRMSSLVWAFKTVDFGQTTGPRRQLSLYGRELEDESAGVLVENQAQSLAGGCTNPEAGLYHTPPAGLSDFFSSFTRLAVASLEPRSPTLRENLISSPETLPVNSMRRSRSWSFKVSTKEISSLLILPSVSSASR